MKTREQMIADGWTYYPAGTKYANHTICCQVIVDGEGNLIAFKPHDEAPKPAEMAPQLAGYWRDPELPIETLTFDWGATIQRRCGPTLVPSTLIVLSCRLNQNRACSDTTNTCRRRLNRRRVRPVQLT